MLKKATFSNGTVRVVTDVTGQKMKKTFDTEALFNEWFEDALRTNQGDSVGYISGQRSDRIGS